MQVYLITNNVTGKLYVGQTALSLKHRWGQHKSDTKRMRGPLHLVHSIRKHGFESFSMELLHECETREEMDFVEMFYIALLDTKAPKGYNLTDGGDGTQGRSGYKLSEETKRKLKEAHTGPKNHMFGKVLTDEHKAKLRESHLGKKQSPETIAKRMLGREWKHGTAAGYGKHKCRCELCRKWRHDSYVKKFGIKTKEEISNNLRESHLGQIPWNAGTGKGVYQRDNGRWRVSLWLDGKLKSYGTFKTKEEAEQRLAEVRRVTLCKDVQVNFREAKN